MKVLSGFKSTLHAVFIRTSGMTPRKVLLLEFNEVNWPVIDQLIAERGAGYLPNFGRLRREGVWATPIALEQPPHLDPWVTWVTVLTGVEREVHGASVLEQDAASLHAKRLWDYVDAAGRSVGIFGSISAYPPRLVNGFMVPGPFAPGDETFPEELTPVQALNRRYTQVHNKTRQALGPIGLAAMASQLIRLGLRFGTIVAVVGQLVRERFNPRSRWRRVVLQPLLNYDFFAQAYRRAQPDFATWHTNHAAHYMHHYWRAWDDKKFSVRSSATERADFGEAVPLGYRICDELIGRFLALVDRKTVLVVASSMGQQPFVTERYPIGKIVVRIRDIKRFLSILGAEGVVSTVPTMVPQWNLSVPDPRRRADLVERIEGILRGADGPSSRAVSVEQSDDLLTITPTGLSGNPEGIRYFFTRSPGAKPDGYALDELFATDTPTVKQGMHHPSGMLAMIGPGIQGGLELSGTNNLDIAPTLLTLLGVPVPSAMKGRVLSEAWGARQVEAAACGREPELRSALG